MRRLIQQEPSMRLQRVLRMRQEKVDGGQEPVKKLWKSFSRLKVFEELRESLGAPLGVRRRCAYCSDSNAADVEHFRPKEDFPENAFSFDNFLLVCPECNRKKNAQFPVDHDNRPLMINPLFDDPWDSLFFVPTTGMLDSRIISAQGTRSPKGAATLDVLAGIINSDSRLIGRARSWGELVQKLQDVLSSNLQLPPTQQAIFKDIDDYGLAEWLLNREGKEVGQVADLRLRYRDRWKMIRDLPRA